MTDPRIVELDGVIIECRVADTLTPSVLRSFAGTTPLDAEVDALPVPDNPRWLRVAVRCLRFYRARIARKLGQRCVFEPSCSRYAELALRRHGPKQGLMLTLRRLVHCRPGRGGVDVP